MRSDMNSLLERPRRISVVVLTHNRVDQLLSTLAMLLALPDRPPIVVVDNDSSDGTSERVAQCYPSLRVVRAQCNLGAAGRNLGVAAVTTEYVAFCDDDMWWQAGALTRAVDILDAFPSVAVLAARIVVGESELLDETCEAMKTSPLGAEGLPGPAVIGFLAGASVFRAAVFEQVGGFEPRLFIGGEEELVSLDVLARGLMIVYADDVVLHHHPSPLRDSALRRRLLARNAAWTAWLRLPAAEACAVTRRALAAMRAEGTLMRDASAMLAGLPWAFVHRRVISRNVRRMRAIVHASEAGRSAGN
ncbi:transferase [Caballeronia terrestris]|uniref:Transferase n=1 Tax=Caballeronia terrestris TaxID=1226301 RepID=A0A158L109_9BURK|nr:glycosyltransferase [Caballeronia terrestris]SAL87064.1 transferase [Caballeronia terrestris]